MTGPSDTDVAYTRVASDDVYDLIQSDLNTAISGLDNTYRTRASKAGAQVLLAKVELTRGNYAEARSLLESVVATGNYSLESNFHDVFYDEGQQ